jgi:hypothetical protein
MLARGVLTTPTDFIATGARLSRSSATRSFRSTTASRRPAKIRDVWPVAPSGLLAWLASGPPPQVNMPCYGMDATVRNNLFYYENACGNSIGGYALATAKGGGSNGGGSSYHDVFVNNTLFDNGTQPGNDSEGTTQRRFPDSEPGGQRSRELLRKQRNVYESAASPYLLLPICGSTATSPLRRRILCR